MPYAIAVIIASLAAIAKASYFSLGPLAAPGFGPDPAFGYSLAGTAVVRQVLAVLPLLFVWYRWLKEHRNFDGFLPPPFRAAGRGWYKSGMLFIWLGHVAALGYAVQIVVRLVRDHVQGPEDGISGWMVLLLYKLGPTLAFYWIGIICIEIGIRKWRKAPDA